MSEPVYCQLHNCPTCALPARARNANSTTTQRIVTETHPLLATKPHNILPRDINLSGQSVSVTSGLDTLDQRTKFEAQQSGVTVALSSTVVSAVQGAVSTGQTLSHAASNTSSGRMQGLAGAAGALAAYNTYKQAKDILKDPGKTTLTGAQITSTDKAVQGGKNSFKSAGGLDMQDLQNSAQYDASSYSVSATVRGDSRSQNAKKEGSSQEDGQSKDGTPVADKAAKTTKGKPEGSAGFGSDSGQGSSTSTAGISGVAGDTTARTGDEETGLKPLFDAAKAKADVQGQVAITAEFGKNASKAWGDFATNKENELRSQGQHEEADKWREGGTYRAAGHFAIGGLGGGGAGALASGGISLAADKLNSLQDELKDKLIELGMSPDAAQMFSQGAGMATSGTVGGGSAFNTDTNNRQLHPDDRKKAKELTAKAKAMGLTKPDGSAYTQEDIEEQMRLMGNAVTKEQPNTTTALTRTDAIVKSIENDPGMPKTAQGPAVMEVPGQANAQLQSWIIDNTRDGFQYIPGQSPYSPSNAALNGPKLTNTPNDQTKTAACGNNDLTCKSGVGAQQSTLPELSQSARQAIADVAADTSRQAGVIGSGATAATAVVPPVLKPVTGAVSVGATVIGVGADAVEQVARPDTGQTVTNLFGSSLQEAANNTPIGKVASPITNELIEAWKKSDTNQSIQDWVNELLKKLKGQK